MLEETTVESSKKIYVQPELQIMGKMNSVTKGFKDTSQVDADGSGAEA
ncbi:MAG: hypothetical protein U9O24_00045 [Campylobacterota bacterium]|nr:hypothetical protein [Campylobacterota bacterium]